jgi:hypothetical protein
MSEIRKWLEAIGLGQYADAFEANDIDMDLLRQIDDVGCERSIHLCFVGMNGRPLGRASCQSPKPKGGAEGAEIDSERVCQATIGSP